MQNLDYLVECNFTEAVDTLDKNYVAHAKCEMFLLLHGDVTVLINSQKYRVHDGALILLSTRDMHLALNNTPYTYRRITMHFDPKVVQMFNTKNTNLLACFNIASSSHRNIIYLDESQIKTYTGFASKIAPYWGSKAYGDDLTAISALISLLVFVNQLYRTQTAPAPLPCSQLITDLVSYIDANLDEELTIKKLAHRFSYSEAYLSAQFSKQMGVTLKYFINTKKIAYAKQLLQGSCSVMQACDRCGFNDYSNFIRAFKKIVGMPPHQWKKEQQARLVLRE